MLSVRLCVSETLASHPPFHAGQRHFFSVCHIRDISLNIYVRLCYKEHQLHGVMVDGVRVRLSVYVYERVWDSTHCYTGLNEEH